MFPIAKFVEQIRLIAISVKWGLFCRISSVQISVHQAFLIKMEFVRLARRNVKNAI